MTYSYIAEGRSSFVPAWETFRYNASWIQYFLITTTRVFVFFIIRVNMKHHDAGENRTESVSLTFTVYSLMILLIYTAGRTCGCLQYLFSDYLRVTDLSAWPADQWRRGRLADWCVTYRLMADWRVVYILVDWLMRLRDWFTDCCDLDIDWLTDAWFRDWSTDWYVT
jgi:hypothetical protein